MRKQALQSAKRQETPNKHFLTIAPALPLQDKRKRAHTTLTTASDATDSVTVQSLPDGSVLVVRSQAEKEKNPDRINLDRRGLTVLPVIQGESRLRLLSLQHNLISSLQTLKKQNFPFLVFLDVYDNQLERIGCLDVLLNLRVLLLGKNRIKKIEGLENLSKVEVLDLHGNQILQVGGLGGLSGLKVLNLAGNQIKNVGVVDLHGLTSLEELNLRRNRIKKLLAFGETPNLQKLFLSNNELQTLEDISSIAKSTNIKEISIDNNPISLAGDCVSFLVSYLPTLTILNGMQITEQVRKAAMAWRRNKEASNAAFLDLTSDVCLHVRREEVISNARTNWELLRSQTKCLASKTPDSGVKLESDFVLKPEKRIKVPALADKKMRRTSSQESQNTSSSNTSSGDFFRLPPILVPIINKMEQKSLTAARENHISDSLSSLGPNVDSSTSSLISSDSEECEKQAEKGNEIATKVVSETNSEISVNTAQTNTSSSGTYSVNSKFRRNVRNIRSAVNVKTAHVRQVQARAVTAKPKKQISPVMAPVNKDREQGGDYLIEICGRFLNIYGQGALKYIDKPWDNTKANDVNTVKLNYANFNGMTGLWGRLKQRFPNAEHFIFKETNIQYLGQLNALAEIQGLQSLFIEAEGNPIVTKNWRSYAIFRLSHWGLRLINGEEVKEEEITAANEEYQGLSDLILWSLPDVLLQPLLARLRLEGHESEQKAKKWLLAADPALRSVVTKEALQWKKSAVNQDDIALKQKAKFFIGSLLDETCNTVNKLRVLEQQWPSILQEIVCNTLVDYSQLDRYMKEKIQELQ